MVFHLGPRLGTPEILEGLNIQVLFSLYIFGNTGIFIVVNRCLILGSCLEGLGGVPGGPGESLGGSGGPRSAWRIPGTSPTGLVGGPRGLGLGFGGPRESPEVSREAPEGSWGSLWSFETETARAKRGRRPGGLRVSRRGLADP